VVTFFRSLKNNEEISPTLLKLKNSSLFGILRFLGLLSALIGIIPLFVIVLPHPGLFLKYMLTIGWLFHIVPLLMIIASYFFKPNFVLLDTKTRLASYYKSDKFKFSVSFDNLKWKTTLVIGKSGSYDIELYVDSYKPLFQGQQPNKYFSTPYRFVLGGSGAPTQKDADAYIDKINDFMSYVWVQDETISEEKMKRFDNL